MGGALDDGPAGMSEVSRETAEQAQRCGIALHYSSFWGEEKQVGEDVLRRALEAMGASHEHRPPATHNGFPGVRVAAEGAGARIEWRGAPGAGTWRLTPIDVADGAQARGGEVASSGDDHTIELPGDLERGYWQLVAPARSGPAECLVIVAPPRCWVPGALEAGERWWGCTVQLYALRSSHDWGIGDFGDLRRLVEIASRQGASFIGLSPLHALFPHRPDTASPYSPSSRNALNPIYLDVQLLLDQSGCREAALRATKMRLR